MSDYTAPTPEQVEEINTSIRYAAYSVFRAAGPLPQDRAGMADQVRELFTELESQGLVVRGVYDVAALRAAAEPVVFVVGRRRPATGARRPPVRPGRKRVRLGRKRAPEKDEVLRGVVECGS